jgi:hypothetical protein
MIKDFWVLNTSGLLLYSRNFTDLEKPDDLLAGFFTAIRVFIEETTQGEIKSIIMKKQKFSYILGEDIIIVILTDKTDNDILIHKFLKIISKKFLAQYSKIIKHFNGDTIQFESFYEILEKEIDSSELLIRCKSCNKVIVNEFRIIEHNNEKNYFCCPMCEKIYCDLNDIDNAEN